MIDTGAVDTRGETGQSDEDVADDLQISRLMESALHHLGMHMSWVSRVAGGEQIIDLLAGDAAAFGVSLGDSSDYQSSYCHQISTGIGAGVVADAVADPRTAELPITRTMGIGAYAGAPVRLADGRFYGMLCCFSTEAMPSLDGTAVKVLAVLAELMTDVLARREARNLRREQIRRRTEDVLHGGGPGIVYQPIFRLSDRAVQGYEALARFPAGNGGPDRWFAEAAIAGCQAELELTAIENALRGSAQLPPQLYLSVNASSDLLGDDRLVELVRTHSGRRLAVEVTEHVRVTDYSQLRVAAGRLRSLGVSIAADDAGAGFAGLRHLVDLAPDCIKIDMSIVRNADSDPARQAMISALVTFAEVTGAELLAEGIETEAELATMTRLGVQRGQGFLLGRPEPLDPAAATAPALLTGA